MEAIHQVGLLWRRVEYLRLAEPDLDDRDIGVACQVLGHVRRLERLHWRPVEAGRFHLHGLAERRQQCPCHSSDHRIQHGADMVQGRQVHQRPAIHHDLHADCLHVAEGTGDVYRDLRHPVLRLHHRLHGGVWRELRRVSHSVELFRVPHEVVLGQLRFQHRLQCGPYRGLGPHRDLHSADDHGHREPLLCDHDPGPCRHDG
mmetsp:Transcript_132375/g.382688  ORF Transcript_132375/g.382688 Transcript_132375/m.382688 type:complete len:202 (-) Transcript_132375:722-1327(-)